MHVFITGGTRGIGKGLVREFLSKGHKVSYTGTSQDSIERSKSEMYGDFMPYVCDVRNQKMICEAMDKAIETFGNIDIWINNAGVDQARLVVSELSDEDIRTVIDVNVIGTIFGTNVALNHMKKQNFGRIYNLEGLGSNNMVIPKTVIYGSSKRLITYFTKGCNKELKDYKKIYVGTIQPGMVFTDLLLWSMNEEGMKIANILGNEVEYVAKIIVSRILKGRKHIKVMNNMQVIGRFMRSMFIKKRKR